MKKIIILIFVLSIHSFLRGADDSKLDVAIYTPTRAEIFKSVANLRRELSPQVVSDLEIAIQRININVSGMRKMGFNDRNLDFIFVSFINNKTPRQIILTAAVLALSEFNSYESSHVSIDGRNHMADDEAYFNQAKSEALSFLRYQGVVAEP